MDSTKEENRAATILMQIVMGLLLLVVLIMSLITVWAVMNIVVVVTSNLAVRLLEGTVQQSYTVATARNAWVVCGGALWLGFMVGASEYFSRRLTKPNTRRFLIIALIVEVVISLIGFSII